MDKDTLRESALFRKLLADAKNMEGDLRTFNARYRDFLEQDDAPLCTVLRCHLIVEHFLDCYLRAANPIISDWDQARLGFAQKLALADNPRTGVHMLIPGLRCLNKIRNRIAHQLVVDLKPADLEPVRSFFSLWHGALGEPVPDGLALLEKFTLTASGWLYGYVCGIERHGPRRGLTGLLEWYADDDPGEPAQGDRPAT
jgi:hypothetical protein